MAAERAPAFQWYPKDFLSDGSVMRMSMTERGVYITLLSVCWLERDLPADMRDLSRIVGVPTKKFSRMWAGPLSSCFQVGDNGRLIHKRLEKERTKQEEHRERNSAHGRKGAGLRWNKATPSRNDSHPIKPVSPKHDSSSSFSSPISKEDARSKRPMFTGQRLTVFEWQLEDCMRTLGEEHTEQFDLHSWFFDLDQRAVNQGLVIPKRDGGVWLQSQLVAEAQRRGIPLRMATTTSTMGKGTQRLASALANIRAEDE